MLAVFISSVVLVGLLRLCELCPTEYYVIDADHSFCSYPMPGVVNQPIDLLERERILEMHNQERRLVHASNMQKMYWNDDLAEIAQHYARKCNFEHDRPSQRSAPKIPLSTGQNLAMGYENWDQAIQAWIDEKHNYYYGFPSSGIVGHYTQMIWHSTALIGCGAAICPPDGIFNMPWRFYVCNYITGQLNSDYQNPYEHAYYDKPLHDCRGKVCLYNGNLDPKTCECHCSSYANGPECERLNCSALPLCPYYSSQACIAVNVPLECPGMCGLCERYEVLKAVFGENNLAPNAQQLETTTRKMMKPNKKKTNGRKMKDKPRDRYFNSSSVTTKTITSASTRISLTRAFYSILASITLRSMHNNVRW